MGLQPDVYRVTLHAPMPHRDVTTTGEQVRDMSIPIALIGLVIGATAIIRAVLHRDSGQDAADILALLWTQDGPISQSDICRNCNMLTQDVVAGLARLERLGLVQGEWDGNTRTDLFRAVRQGEGEVIREARGIRGA